MSSPLFRTARPLLLVWSLAVLGQALLALNPGYFSHDELQWGATADVADGRALPWVGWADVDTFQWRPLTFNAWLLLSHLLFDAPEAFHALWVALGAAVAAALAGLLQRLGATPRTAVAAGLLFALNPYAAYVHGWVGTLADLLWVGCGLALAHGLLSLHQRAAAPATGALLAFVLTTLGLLAKEAALALPALLGLLWCLHRRERLLAGAVLGSGLAALVYLGMRLGTLLTPAGPDAYSFTPEAVPRNALAYPLFLLQPSAFEVGALWNASGLRLAVALGLWLMALVCLLRRAPRRAVLLVAGSGLALAPALPLGMPANQYGYGFSAWLIACAALAWPSLSRGGRGLLLGLALISTWHGLNVQREMRRIGELQAVFQPALVQALRTQPGPVRLLPAGPDQWIYRRLTHQVPAWRGEKIGERVRWAEAGETAAYRIGSDGRLSPAR